MASARGQAFRQRRLPVGAEVVAGGTHFRVWAPRRRELVAVLEGGAALPLAREADGYFSGFAPGVGAGALYRYRLDGGGRPLPDPVSRFQPQGPHGPSQVIDPSDFPWTDASWGGVPAADQVLYELHCGTFTREGTWQAAIRELPRLAEVGVTCLELMPVADFAGTFGWGYDCVDLFAPSRLYGSPDDFRAFIDRAHALGVGVILDVVYNHFGPDGNYLKEFSDRFFSQKHKTDWGDGINFDGEGNGPVREFFLSNVRYWIEEFHLDGFRFDATQAIRDTSPEHILTAISREAKAAGERLKPGRSIYLVNENEPQRARLVRPPEQGGCGMTSQWNDDFHHSSMVVLSGRNEAYYTDHAGTPQEFISAAKYGYLFQGQRYAWQHKRRGTPALDLPPTAFVHFIQNHDQVANSARGLRAHRLSSPGQYRAMTALLLLMPQTPMLFQGQEFAASSPFYYFADHEGELAKLVREGRAKELSEFPCVATPAIQARLPDPADRKTFESSKLNWPELSEPAHAEVFELHKELLRLRRETPVFRRVQRRGDVDGAVLGPDAFLLRYFGSREPDGAADPASDRLLLFNFGRDLTLHTAPEPLLAPPLGMRWAVQWSSEDPRFGGCGTPAPDTEEEGWMLPGRCAIVLEPKPEEEAAVRTRFARKGEVDLEKERRESEGSP